MEQKRQRCTVSCILVALCMARSEARPSRMLAQLAYGVNSSNVLTVPDGITDHYFAPHWGVSFMGTGSPTNQNVWAPTAAPQNSSAIFFMSRPNEMRYTITLQAVLAPGDQVQQVTLAGSISNDTGERPVVAYLFGVEAIGMANNSNLGVDAPAYAADGQAPWVIASGVIYPEDITDDSPYLFSELPGRFTGSYSGYNQDPLYVSVRTTSAKEAFVAGMDNGIKPLNAAALQYVDQDTVDLGDSSDSSNSGEGTGSLTASGGNTAPAAPDAASTGGLLAAASVAAPAAAPSGNLTAVTLATDPNLSNGTPMPAAAPGTAIVASSGSLGPAAAAPAVDSTAAVAYGASSFHVDMAASPGVNTNASGLVMFFLNPMESSLHYRMYLRGVSNYALIQNVTFFATDGPDQSGIPRLILSKAFGLPNGPGNPTGGFGVPQNRSSTWVLTTGNSPDETVLSIPGNGDLEMSRYRQFSNALRYNKLRAHLTTVVHPDGLLDGVSAVGLSRGNWPIPSW